MIGSTYKVIVVSVAGFVKAKISSLLGLKGIMETVVDFQLPYLSSSLAARVPDITGPIHLHGFIASSSSYCSSVLPVGNELLLRNLSFANMTW